MTQSHTYVLINDTTTELHWGCWGVTNTIIDLLQSRSKLVCTITTEQLKHKTIEVLLRYIQSSVGNNKFSIVVNGEGSLHDGNVEGRRIIDLVAKCKEMMPDKYVEHHIWNCSVYSLPVTWRGIFSSASSVIVRDKLSRDVLSGVCNPKVVPDLLFKFGLDHITSRQHNGTIISDAVNRNHKDTVRKIGISNFSFIDIRWGIFEYISVCRDRGFIGISLFKLCTLFYRTFFRSGFLSFDGRSLSFSENMYIGRYHLCVLYLLFGKSFNSLESNSVKIEALLEYVISEFKGIKIRVDSRDGYNKVCVEKFHHEKLREYINDGYSIYKESLG